MERNGGAVMETNTTVLEHYEITRAFFPVVGIYAYARDSK